MREVHVMRLVYIKRLTLLHAHFLNNDSNNKWERKKKEKDKDKDANKNSSFKFQSSNQDNHFDRTKQIVQKNYKTHIPFPNTCSHSNHPHNPPQN